MKPPRSLKERFGDSLSLSFKLRLKRVFVGAVAAALRLGVGARGSGFAGRVVALAVTHGLDFERARRDVYPPAPLAGPPGATDFLSLLSAVSDRKPSGPLADRDVRASIIIPVFNKAEFTFQCLNSLVREVDFGETEIIVVNNASTDETAQMPSHLGDFVRVIDNAESPGFVDACNRGAAAAKGCHLVFLNNDTVVLPGWLGGLLKTVESDPQVGAVGSMLLYPDGRIQEAGAIVWKTGEAFHYGRGKSPADRRFNFAREVDCCSGASLLVRKELFERLGGFNRIFDRLSAPASYADADLCFGVRALGSKVVYQPASRLVHDEGATAGTDTGADSKKYQVANRAKFYEKWRDVLEREHLPNDPALIGEASDRKDGPRVLVIDDRLPTPDRDAGSARMVFILKALAQWSRPVFVYLSKEEQSEYEKQLWRAGVETARAANLGRLLKERKFYAAVLSRPDVAEALMPLVRRSDANIKIVFDMVDAYFIRFGREYDLTGDAHAAREAARFRRVETRLARRSDLVWCASTTDAEVVRREAPGVRVEVIPTIHTLHTRGKPFDERRHLLFIGHLRHRPNVDAVHFLAREILPLVRESLPDVELHVVGDHAPPEILSYASESVRLLGYVPDVDPLFASARVMVAPLRFGAGAKGKIGEALSYGLPVVTTSVGAEGMGFTNGSEVLVADDPREFAREVVRAYRDGELWQRLSDSGSAHVEKHFTPEVVGRVINESVKSARGEKRARGESDEAVSTGAEQSR